VFAGPAAVRVIGTEWNCVCWRLAVFSSQLLQQRQTRTEAIAASHRRYQLHAVIAASYVSSSELTLFISYSRDDIRPTVCCAVCYRDWAPPLSSCRRTARVL